MADVVASTQRTRQDNTENTSKCCVKCFIKYKIWHSPLVKGYLTPDPRAAPEGVGLMPK